MKSNKLDTRNVTIGELIDGLYNQRSERLVLSKQVDAMKKEETRLTDEIQERLLESGLEGAKGRLATASRTISTVPHVMDWQALHDFIRETGHFQLLQKRVSNPAYIELLELGIEMPGTEPTELPKLSLTRSKK